MKKHDFNVHVYAVVRIPIQVKALSPVDAVKEASKCFDQHSDSINFKSSGEEHWKGVCVADPEEEIEDVWYDQQEIIEILEGPRSNAKTKK